MMAFTVCDSTKSIAIGVNFLMRIRFDYRQKTYRTKILNRVKAYIFLNIKYFKITRPLLTSPLLRPIILFFSIAFVSESWNGSIAVTQQ